MSKAGPTPHIRPERNIGNNRKVAGKRNRWKSCCKNSARKRVSKRMGMAQIYPIRG